jgi:hypothetical protein
VSIVVKVLTVVMVAVAFAIGVFAVIVNNVQWVPLNGITDNEINELMRSKSSRLTSPKLFFHTLCMLKLIRLLLSVGYRNQFVSVAK